MSKRDELPKTRAEALKIGSTHYFTGKQCKNRHRTVRYARQGQCKRCMDDCVARFRRRQKRAKKALEASKKRAQNPAKTS